jgi:hypothetical protein
MYGVYQVTCALCLESSRQRQRQRQRHSPLLTVESPSKCDIMRSEIAFCLADALERTVFNSEQQQQQQQKKNAELLLKLDDGAMLKLPRQQRKQNAGEQQKKNADVLPKRRLMKLQSKFTMML